MKFKIFIGITFLFCLNSLYLKSQNSFEELLDIASKDDDMAQYQLGLRYLEGNGTSKNYYQATHWFAQSHRNGNDSIIKDMQGKSFQNKFPGYKEFLKGLVEYRYKNNKLAAPLYFLKAYHLSGLQECKLFHYLYNLSPNLTQEQLDSISNELVQTEPLCQYLVGTKMMRNATNNDSLMGIMLIFKSVVNKFPYGHNFFGFLHSDTYGRHYDETRSAYHLLQAEKHKVLEYQASLLLSYYYEHGLGGLPKDEKRAKSIEASFVESTDVLLDFFKFVYQQGILNDE